MSAPTGFTADSIGEWAAERHEQDVLAILNELRRPQRVTDRVIEEAFRLELGRGEVTADQHDQFVDWARDVLRRARSNDQVPDDAGWSDALAGVLRRYLAIAGSRRTTAANVAGAVEAARAEVVESLAAEEEELSDLVGGVLISSVRMWSADPAAKEDKGIDLSQVAVADVMGGIIGAATGGLTGTGAAGAAAGGAVGAALGSAVDAALQDTRNDAVEETEPADPGPTPHD